MDWKWAKKEYVTNQGATYRSIAQSLGCCLNQVYRHSKEEKWQDARRNYVEKQFAKTAEKIAEQTSTADAKAIEDYNKAARTALDKVMQSLAGLEPEDRDGTRKLVACIKDLRECLGIRSDMDTREQAAKIANLEKQAADGEQQTQDIHVTFDCSALQKDSSDYTEQWGN